MIKHIYSVCGVFGICDLWKLILAVIMHQYNNPQQPGMYTTRRIMG